MVVRRPPRRIVRRGTCTGSTFAARRAFLAEHVDLLRAGANVPEVRRARQAVVPIPPGASVRGRCALMCAMRSVGEGKGMLERRSVKRTCVSAVSPMRARCCTTCGELPLLSPGAVSVAPPLKLSWRESAANQPRALSRAACARWPPTVRPSIHAYNLLSRAPYAHEPMACRNRRSSRRVEIRVTDRSITSPPLAKGERCSFVD